MILFTFVYIRIGDLERSSDFLNEALIYWQCWAYNLGFSAFMFRVLLPDSMICQWAVDNHASKDHNLATISPSWIYSDLATSISDWTSHYIPEWAYKYTWSREVESILGLWNKRRLNLDSGCQYLLIISADYSILHQSDNTKLLQNNFEIKYPNCMKRHLNYSKHTIRVILLEYLSFIF